MQGAFHCQTLYIHYQTNKPYVVKYRNVRDRTYTKSVLDLSTHMQPFISSPAA